MRTRKLTRRDLYRIRSMHAGGRTLVEIGRRIGINPGTVRDVLSGHLAVVESMALLTGEPRKVIFSQGIGRCGECGRQIVLPCMACRRERQRKHQRAAERLTEEDLAAALRWKGVIAS